MKLAQIGPVGHEEPIALIDGTAWSLRPLTPRIDGTFLASDPLPAIMAALDRQELPAATITPDTRYGSPIARPGAVICVGMNYAAHAAESGAEPPEHMVIFMKHPNTVSGPFDDVVIPPGSTATDWEVELGIVIGETCSYLDSPEQARERIAGYTVVNDLSERHWQLDISGGQWCKGKSGPGFSPTGPYLVTSDEIDPTALGIRSWVNGQVRQDSNTVDMIFPVDQIIFELSQVMMLDPGDLILTGTPEGVGLSGRFEYLKSGDTAEFEIDGLGRQRQEYR